MWVIWLIFVVFEETVIQCCLHMALGHLLSVTFLIHRGWTRWPPEVPSYFSGSLKSKLFYFQIEHLQLECLQNILKCHWGDLAIQAAEIWKTFWSPSLPSFLISLTVAVCRKWVGNFPRSSSDLIFKSVFFLFPHFQLAREVLDVAAMMVKAGVTTEEIDHAVHLVRLFYCFFWCFQLLSSLSLFWN